MSEFPPIPLTADEMARRLARAGERVTTSCVVDRPQYAALLARAVVDRTTPADVLRQALAAYCPPRTPAHD